MKAMQADIGLHGGADAGRNVQGAAELQLVLLQVHPAACA
jgi:hypothetical protein